MTNDDIQPLTVTVEQAAKLLGIGRSTAYELVHTGEIPSLRLGRRILVPSSYITSATGLAPSSALAPRSEGNRDSDTSSPVQAGENRFVEAAISGQPPRPTIATAAETPSRTRSQVEAFIALHMPEEPQKPTQM
jgi:excisionase family DNA binding protein